MQNLEGEQLGSSPPQIDPENNNQNSNQSVDKKKQLGVWALKRLLPVTLGIFLVLGIAIAAVPSWRNYFTNILSQFGPRADVDPSGQIDTRWQVEPIKKQIERGEENYLKVTAERNKIYLPPPELSKEDTWGLEYDLNTRNNKISRDEHYLSYSSTQDFCSFKFIKYVLDELSDDTYMRIYPEKANQDTKIDLEFESHAKIHQDDEEDDSDSFSDCFAIEGEEISLSGLRGFCPTIECYWYGLVKIYLGSRQWLSAGCTPDGIVSGSIFLPGVATGHFAEQSSIHWTYANQAYPNFEPSQQGQTTTTTYEPPEHVPNAIDFIGSGNICLQSIDGGEYSPSSKCCLKAGEVKVRCGNQEHNKKIYFLPNAHWTTQKDLDLYNDDQYEEALDYYQSKCLEFVTDEDRNSINSCNIVDREEYNERICADEPEQVIIDHHAQVNARSEIIAAPLNISGKYPSLRVNSFDERFPIVDFLNNNVNIQDKFPTLGTSTGLDEDDTYQIEISDNDLMIINDLIEMGYLDIPNPSLSNPVVPLFVGARKVKDNSIIEEEFGYPTFPKLQEVFRESDKIDSTAYAHKEISIVVPDGARLGYVKKIDQSRDEE
jgi:hypothetical protein